MSILRIRKHPFFDTQRYISPRFLTEDAVTVNNVDTLPLTEELHSFDGQLSLTQEVAEHVYWMLRQDKTTQEYYPNNEVFNVILLNIKPNDTNTIKAQLDGLNKEEKKLIITVFINKLLLGFQSQDILIKRISHVITHELMHGYIFTQQDLEDEPSDIPEYYGGILAIMRYGEYESMHVQDLAYALYSTYYQETQAIISQANINLKMLIGDDQVDMLTSTDLVRLIKRTEPYNIFYNNLKIANKVLQFSDEQVQNIIVDVFTKYHINCDIKWVRKQCNNIIKISQKALKKIIRNALLILEN